MRKIAILLTTILLTGGVFTSCENFLNGEKIKQEIEDQIALANAPAFPIQIDGNKGKFSPSKGSYPLKVTQSMNISFESDTDFEFIRWEVFNTKTGESLDSDGYIEFKDSMSDETSIKLLREPGPEMQLGVRSIVSARPQIVSYTPSSLGMLKDSTIQILFNRDMEPDSIYYSEKEREELKVSERISDANFLHTVLGDETKYYGYTKGGKTFFKNIILTNNKTGDNINDRFEAPVFESPRALSIFASKKSGHILEDFTQVLVEVEKGFFYTEQEKNVEMAGSKMWMYQVNNRNDDKSLVISKSGSTELFSAKFKSDNTDFIKSASFALNQSGFGALKFIKNGNFKFDLNIEVEEQDGGSGPNSYFTVTVKKLYGVNYAASTYEKSFTLYYQTVTSDTAVFEGSVDLEQEKVSLGDGVYEVVFDFMDRSGNHLIYPSGSHFYFAVDTKAPEISIPTISSTNSTTYTLNWSDYVDLKTAEITLGKNGSTPTSLGTISKGTVSKNIEDIVSDNAYDIKIKFTDYAGNSVVKTVPKFLTGYTFTGTLNFMGNNASHAQNIFLAGDKISDYGITAKKYYSDGSSTTVGLTTNDTIPTRSSYNSSWTYAYTYSEGNISKNTVLSGTYYIAKKDSLTQKPEYLGTDGGWKKYKFGDYPQSVSTISNYTPSTVYNGWYLGSDGYFYEKCTATIANGKGSIKGITNGKTYYFKVEPIQWRKLTDSYSGHSLLSAYMVLDQCVYCKSSSNRTISGSTVYPNNYKYSTLRAFLNGKYESGDNTNSSYSNKGFLQKAFTSAAQSKIKTMSVDNGGNDKIFTLSHDELKNTNYGFSSALDQGTWRKRDATQYGTAKNLNSDGGGGFYWTRTPSYQTNGHVDIVYCYGNIKRWEGGVAHNDFGIVPALCVSSSDLP